MSDPEPVPRPWWWTAEVDVDSHLQRQRAYGMADAVLQTYLDFLPKLEAELAEALKDVLDCREAIQGWSDLVEERARELAESREREGGW